MYTYVITLYIVYIGPHHTDCLKNCNLGGGMLCFVFKKRVIFASVWSGTQPPAVVERSVTPESEETVHSKVIQVSLPTLRTSSPGLGQNLGCSGVTATGDVLSMGLLHGGHPEPSLFLLLTMPLAWAVVPISCHNGLWSEKHPSWNELVMKGLLVEDVWGGARWCNFFYLFCQQRLPCPKKLTGGRNLWLER